jgi:hypothetical protein
MIIFQGLNASPHNISKSKELPGLSHLFLKENMQEGILEHQGCVMHEIRHK